MDGILVVDKPKSCTSHDVVYQVKNIFHEKVGHTGTLDPNATGVLPLLIGKATQVSKYLINHDKVYETVIELGKKTDTGDIEGQVIEEKIVNTENITTEKIQFIFQSIVGKQKQIPPMFSAIKVKGKKLYEYARKGEKIQVEPRDIEVYSLELLSFTEKEISLRIACSKGTYIRTLCEKIAEKLQTLGYMKELRRIQVGDFSIKQAISLEELEKNKDNMNYLTSQIITIEQLFKEKQKIILEEKKLLLFLNGVKLNYDLMDGLYCIYTKNQAFIGTGIIQDNRLKRDIIL